MSRTQPRQYTVAALACQGACSVHSDPCSHIHKATGRALPTCCLSRTVELEWTESYCAPHDIVLALSVSLQRKKLMQVTEMAPTLS